MFCHMISGMKKKTSDDLDSYISDVNLTEPNLAIFIYSVVNFDQYYSAISNSKTRSSIPTNINPLTHVPEKILEYI
jgi:hypothetical protein